MDDIRKMVWYALLGIWLLIGFLVLDALGRTVPPYAILLSALQMCFALYYALKKGE